MSIHDIPTTQAPPVITCDAILKDARDHNPQHTFTRNRKGTAIAYRGEDRWHTCAGLCLDGQWVSIGDLLINGEPCNPQSEWID